VGKLPYHYVKREVPVGGKPSRQPKPNSPMGRVGKSRSMYLHCDRWDTAEGIAERLEWSVSRVMDAVLAYAFHQPSQDSEAVAGFLERTAQA